MPVHSQAVHWEKVYVFISSTFGDMHAERDYLVKRVFPALQDWCERRRLRLVDIDLRWGVTEADTTSKRAVEVCLERINDCRPFFLCFLGQRHGWMPKAADVSESTFKKFPALLEALQANASVTELEIQHAILKPFTSTAPDAKHAQPETAEHAFFYFRDAGYLHDLRDAPRQMLCTFTDEAGPDDETDDERQQRERARDALRKLREETIPQDKPVIYQADWHAELTTPELTMPLECTDEWRRKWNRFAHLSLAATDDRIPADKLAAANKYNAALTRGRLSQFRSLTAAREQFPPGTELAQIIQHDLREAIKARFDKHTEVAQETDQQKELDQQEGFLQACSEGFIERTGDFAQLDSYVADDSNKLCVLTAPGGMGKSTLLAKWIDRSRTQPEAQPAIHFRFIGASDRSTTVYSLLRSLLGEMLAAKTLDLEIPLDPNKLREALPELLAAIGKSGKTVIVLDALNQLESGLQDLHWLPRTLPENIKLIVSFKRDDDASEQVYQQFQAAQATLIEVPPFAALEDRRKLVRAYLQQYLKELDEAHIKTLIETKGADNPLYLKVVLSELRVFGAFAGLAKKIHDDFGDNPITAFQGVLQRLASDPAYAPIESQRAVPLLFGLLAHARHGLSVEELTNLFVQALGLEDNEQGRQAAADTINLLLRQVRPFLARREGRYDYFYESFKLAAQQHCAISEEEPSATGWSAPQFHQLLAGLFSRQADPSGNRQWDGHSSRALRDLPYHLLEGRLTEELFRIAREEVFLTAQKRAFPDEPELHLQTIQTAIEGAARIDDAGRMAEFVLAHARRVVEAGQESPLDALRSGQLARAWKLADMYDPERCVLWHLLLVWELNETNRLEEARTILERTERKHLPRLSRWQSKYAAHFLESAFKVSQEKAFEITHHLLNEDGYVALCKSLVSSSYFTEALNLSRQGSDESRAEILSEIACGQARVGQFDQAQQTAQLIISDERRKVEALRAIAQVLAQAGQQNAASQTFARAVETARQISNDGWRAQALKEIAEAQEQEGQFDQALKTAEHLSGWSQAEIQGKIAREQVQAGQQEEANQTFDKAIQTAKRIDFKEDRAKALSKIAKKQAQAGQPEEARQTFIKAIQTAEQSGFGEYIAKALSEIARTQAQAGQQEEASQTFNKATQTAERIDDEWSARSALIEIGVAQAQAGLFDQAFQIAERFSGEQFMDEVGRDMILKEIAQAHAKAEQFDQALKISKQASRWSQSEIRRKIALTQAQVGQFDQARQTANLIEWGGNAEMLSEIAMAQALVQAQAGLQKAAGQTFDQALQADQQTSDEENKARTLGEIARSQALAGQQKIAGQIFDQAKQTAQQISDAGSGAWVLRKIAQAQAEVGQQEAAGQTFGQARQVASQISIKQLREKALAAIARAQTQAGQFDQALQTAEKISGESRSGTLQEIVRELAQAGQFDQALQTARKIGIDGDNAEALKGIAVALAQAGQFDQAIEIALQIKDKDEHRAAALEEVAAAQTQARQFDQAIKTALLIFESRRDMSRGKRARTLPDHLAQTLAQVYQDLQQLSDKLDWGAMVRVIAGVQAQAGQFDQAFQIAEMLSGGNKAEALVKIAEAQAQAGYFAQALQTVKQIINEEERMARALQKIAQAQAQAGQQEAAGQTFDQARQTAQQISDKERKGKALVEIVRAQAQVGQFDHPLQIAEKFISGGNRDEALVEIARAQAQAGHFNQAVETAKKISGEQLFNEVDKDAVLKEIVQAQAQAGFAEQALLTAQTILINRNSHLPAIASAFAEMGNRKSFKRLLIPCAYYLEAAYQLCGLLARLFPEQATAVVVVVISAQRTSSAPPTGNSDDLKK